MRQHLILWPRRQRGSNKLASAADVLVRMLVSQIRIGFLQRK